MQDGRYWKRPSELSNPTFGWCSRWPLDSAGVEDAEGCPLAPTPRMHLLCFAYASCVQGNPSETSCRTPARYFVASAKNAKKQQGETVSSSVILDFDYTYSEELGLVASDKSFSLDFGLSFASAAISQISSTQEGGALPPLAHIEGTGILSTGAAAPGPGSPSEPNPGPGALVGSGRRFALARV
eukprot:CAMPEP_0167775432 /NCGR_PEP_ID=MMETSP0111_2-20121227/2559_1 /TAXON_ID=91324 /ORGANISM="Lotharella globosa, Strain CCCM811" /LENGTH=183 /DNA_ID=CAMNT_0007665353 /DNA_START=595 /DNA_END=1145 /DNA_ORIENTATION=+